MPDNIDDFKNYQAYYFPRGPAFGKTREQNAYNHFCMKMTY